MTRPAAVAGLVLAAGAGTRFGTAKALVRLDGRTFVEIAVAALTDAGCGPVLVVIGARADEVRATSVLAGTTVLENPDWASGMGSSLRVGLAAVPAGVHAVVVSTVDTPWVGAGAVRRLAAPAGPSALARASYHGRPGHPVLIGRDHWAAVAAAATGDVGARDYLNEHGAVTVPCEDIADGTDVDRPADLERKSR